MLGETVRIAAAWWLLGAAACAGQECEPRVVHALGGEFADGEADAGLLALAQGRGGVMLVDVSDARAPVDVGRLSGVEAARVALAGPLLACVSDDGAVTIVDVGRPEAPVVLGATLATGAAGARDAQWIGSALYVASDRGVAVVDASDPARPVGRGPVEGIGAAVGIAHEGGRACVAMGEAGLAILDVSAPLVPQLLGTDPEPAGAAALRGAVAFAAAGAMLRALDISDPSDPVELWTDEAGPAYATAVAVLGDRLYWFQNGWDLAAYDITDPRTRVPLSMRQRWLSPRAVASSGGSLITVGRDEARLSSPASEARTEAVDFITTRGVGLHVVGGRAFVPDEGSVLIVDVSDPASLRVIDSFAGWPSWTNGVHLLSMRGGLLEIWDVREGVSPRRLGSHQLPDSARDFAAMPGLAFVRDDEDEVYVLDWGDPAAPRRLDTGAYPEGLRPYSVTGGGLLCAWDYGRRHLLLLDVTDPEAPVTVGEIATLPYCFGAHIEGDLLFTSERVVRMFDISDPASPRALCVIPGAASALDAEVEGDLLYLASGELTVWDIADRERPRSVGWAAGLTTFSRIERVGGAWAVIVDDIAGGHYQSLATITFDPSGGPALLGRVRTLGGVDAAACAGGVAALSTSYSSGDLWLLDISDAARPAVIGQVVAGYSSEVETDGEHFYLMVGPELHVLAGRSLIECGVVGSLGEVGYVRTMELRGELLYLAAGKSAVIVDVGDPTSPREVGRIAGDRNVAGVSGDGAVACVSYEDSEYVFFDVRDPGSPLKLGSVRWGLSGGRVHYEDGWAVVSAGTALLGVLDAREASGPYLASFVRGTDGPIDRFAVDGDTVYASARGSLMIIDIGDRFRPRLVGERRQIADLGVPLASGGGVFLAGMASPAFAAVDPGCDACPPDLDGDGDADAADFAAFVSAWADQRGQFCHGKHCSADLDGDGDVDTRDFVLYLDGWAGGC